MGSSSKVVRPEEVLEPLMNDGTIDAIRMKIIAQLKANVRTPPSFLQSPSPAWLLATWLLCLGGGGEVPRNVRVDGKVVEWRTVAWSGMAMAVDSFEPFVLLEDMKKNTMMMVEQSKVLNTPGAEKKTKKELFNALRQELETPVLEKASKAVWELILDNGGLGKEITQTVEKVFRRLSGIDTMPPPPSTSGAHHGKEGNMAVEEGEKSKEMDASELSSSRKRPFSDISVKGAGAMPNGGAIDQHDESEEGNQKI